MAKLNLSPGRGGKGRILFLGGEGGGSQGSPYQAVTGKIYRM